MKTLLLCLLCTIGMSFWGGNGCLWAQDEMIRERKIGPKKPKTAKGTTTQPTKQKLSNQSIFGEVIDAATNEPLMDVRIMVVGTNIGTQSDYDGKFRLENLPVGSYNLQATMISYQALQLNGIKVKANQPTKVSLIMNEEGGASLEMLVVEEQLEQSSTAAMLLKQRNATLISDGISGEIVLKETPDFQMATAMRRLPSVALIDDRFISIRGLYERYNVLLFNNAPLPFSDFDRIGFDYNQLQSNLAAQMSIIKSANAETFAEFAGGIVQVETPAIPASNALRVSVQLNYNDRMSFKQALDYPREYDVWRPFVLQHPRHLAKGFPTHNELYNMPMDSPERYQAARQFNKNYVANEYTAPMGYNMNMNYQKRGKWNGHNVGLSSYFSFIDNYRYHLVEENNILQSFDEKLNRNPIGDSMRNRSEFYRQQNITASVNAGIELENMRLSVKNLFIWNNERAATNYIGYTNEEEGYLAYWYPTLRMISTLIYAGQVEGEHYLRTKKTKKTQREQGLRFLWTAHFSTMSLREPGYKGINYLPNEQGSFSFDPSVVAYSTSFNVNHRMQIMGVNARMVVPISSIWPSHTNEQTPKPSEIGLMSGKFTVGSFINLRQRTFRSRRLGLFPLSDTSGNPILEIPEEALDLKQIGGIFRDEHIGPNKLTLHELTTGSYNYNGRSTNVAPYLMYEQRLSRKVKLNAGLRLEYFKFDIDTFPAERYGLFHMTASNQIDLLPSATVVYNIDKSQVARISTARTLTRPQERELVPLPYLDIFTGFVTVGNPVLTRTSIYNLDLRYDYYFSGKELFAATMFFKTFDNPIEQVFIGGDRIATSAFSQIYETKNQSSAQVLGLEMEARVNIGERLDLSALKGLTFYTNLTLIRSQVNSQHIFELLEGKNRRMQGQASYVFNTGLIYNEPFTGLNLGVFYNQAGPRIAFVGTDPREFADIWELERHVIDVQIARMLGKHFEIRLTCSDLLNNPIRQVMIYDNRTRYNPSRDQTMNRYFRGFNTYLTITYRM
jgi:outer membrane receptor protein involved in Fe transport